MYFKIIQFRVYPAATPPSCRPSTDFQLESRRISVYKAFLRIIYFATFVAFREKSIFGSHRNGIKLVTMTTNAFCLLNPSDDEAPSCKRSFSLLLFALIQQYISFQTKTKVLKYLLDRPYRGEHSTEIGFLMLLFSMSGDVL